MVINNVVITFGTFNVPNWSTRTITLPISFTTNTYSFCNHCDVKDLNKTVNTITGNFAWGTGQGYGNIYYSCIGY